MLIPLAIIVCIRSVDFTFYTDTKAWKSYVLNVSHGFLESDGLTSSSIGRIQA